MRKAIELHSTVGAALYTYSHRIYVGGADGWRETLPPEPGEATYLSYFTYKHDAHDVDSTTFVAVPMTSWGDYGGSTIERSNARSLVRDYPDTFVAVSGDYGSESLVLPADADVDDDLFETLVALAEEYPLYDEGDHSELEMELTQERWDSFGAHDLERELSDAGLCEEMMPDADGLWYWLRRAWQGAGFYPYSESATNMILWDAHTVEAILTMIEDEWRADAIEAINRQLPGQESLL